MTDPAPTTVPVTEDLGAPLGILGAVATRLTAKPVCEAVLRDA